MKTVYKYITFVQTALKNHWNCLNKKNKSILGSIYYLNSWKTYVFAPNNEAYTEFSPDCLRDIAHFLEQLNSKDA